MANSSEENTSGEDEVVEDIPWFSIPYQKPLFARLASGVRLTQGSAAGNLDRLKQRVPCNPAFRSSSDYEYLSTPSSSISNSVVTTCQQKNSNVTPGVAKVKLSSLDKDVKDSCEGNVNKSDRVLQNISNCQRAKYPKRLIELEKSNKENECLKSNGRLPKGILRNTSKPLRQLRVLPLVDEASKLYLPQPKDKPISYEPPNYTSDTSMRVSRSSICIQCQQEGIKVKNVEYTVLSKLGRGGSSEVFLAVNKKALQLVAIKCVDLAGADPVTAEGYRREIDLLAQLQSSHRVIKLIEHEYIESEQTLYVVMERGDTDLSTLLKLSAKTGDVSIPMIRYYWTEMLQAVKEIHKHGIVHADLKPANFLLVCGRLKLIDFGIASAIQNDATSIMKNSISGTGNYISPEAVRDPGDSSRTKVGYKSDVWSLGCILYSMLYGHTPFQHITNSFAKLQTIANPNHQIAFPPVPCGCPPSLFSAMKQCLQRDARKRPTVTQLLAVEY